MKWEDDETASYHNKKRLGNHTASYYTSKLLRNRSQSICRDVIYDWEKHSRMLPRSNLHVNVADRIYN